MTRKTITYYERFSLTQRIEHLAMLVSFSILAVTGLPQKFPLNNVAQAVIRLAGGIENIRNIHHVAALALVLVSVYHLLMLGYDLYVKRARMSMLPTFQDGKDALQAFLYNLGFAKRRPQTGRFGFEEKAQYWILVWSVMVMTITGFLMWNPVATTQLLSGEVIPAAKAAHGAEAILAVLVIIIWHFYSVHLKFFNPSMWSGKLKEGDILREHPLELADIKAGIIRPPFDAQQVKKRWLIYYPVATALGALLLFGLYAFATLEKTAIAAIPAPNVGGAVYVPQTATPLPTRAPTNTPPPRGNGPATYENYIGPLFGQKCGACHGASAAGGLNLTTYAAAFKGGNNGPAIVPGKPDDSKLAQIQQAGGHPGQFTSDELAEVVAWISGGALEK